MFKNERHDFQNELRARGIRHLVHFTTEQNLPIILESGSILSRLKLTEITHPDDAIQDAIVTNDTIRLDGKTDFVNLSIEHPNIPLLNAYKRRNSLSYVNWCLLLLDPELIYHEETLFSVTNAASNRARQIGIDGSFASFCRLFDAKYAKTASVSVSKRYTADLQAEVLYKGEVSTRFLREVVFESEAHRVKAVSALRLLGTPIPETRVDADLFSIKRS